LRFKSISGKKQSTVRIIIALVIASILAYVTYVAFLLGVIAFIIFLVIKFGLASFIPMKIFKK
jgi:hypothetical protein